MEEKLLRILGHFCGGNLEILSMKNFHEKIALKKNTHHGIRKNGSQNFQPKKRGVAQIAPNWRSVCGANIHRVGCDETIYLPAYMGCESLQTA